MELVLGTVQFGLTYGIAGRGCAIPPAEARVLLSRAHGLGVRTLDTAAAYGDIEERLSSLCSDNHDFSIVSKIPVVPAQLGNAEAATWAIEQAERSRSRLGTRLTSLMLHRAADLEGVRGRAIWSALQEWGARSGVSIGASCYDPATAVALKSSLSGFAITQLPGNALDQRVQRKLPDDPGFEVHLRSAFLQGLLLMDAGDAVRKVPVSAEPLARWHDWCVQVGLRPLEAALSVVQGFRSVHACVVGVDNLEQLESIAQAWAQCRPIQAPHLHCDEPGVVDPRLWKTTS